MKLLWLYLSAYLLLPIVGESILWITNTKIYAGSSSLSLIVDNIIFVIVLIFTAFFIYSYKRPLIMKKRFYDYNFVNTSLNKSIIVLIFIFIFIFIFSGYKFLFVGIDRGEIRSSLGALGPMFTLVLTYMPIAIIIYNSVLYIHLDLETQRRLRKKLIFIYIMLILVGIVSGYKAVAISLMVPGFIVLFFNKFNLKKMLLFGIFVISILTLFTSLVRHIGLGEAFFFLIHRLTVMTAYGTIGVWNHFPNGASLNDVFINYIGMFGTKMASFLLGISPHEPEFLKTNLSRLVTYVAYPATQRALDNSVNVTVTNFGHALYIFGRYAYHLYAVIMGVIIGAVIRQIYNSILKGNALLGSLIGTYFFAVIIPSINSGGIFMLFSIPVLVYMLLIYLFMKYIIQGELVVF